VRNALADRKMASNSAKQSKLTIFLANTLTNKKANKSKEKPSVHPCIYAYIPPM
jgi:hypothetical protein